MALGRLLQLHIPAQRTGGAVGRRPTHRAGRTQGIDAMKDFVLGLLPVQRFTTDARCKRLFTNGRWCTARQTQHQGESQGTKCAQV